MSCSVIFVMSSSDLISFLFPRLDMVKLIWALALLVLLNPGNFLGEVGRGRIWPDLPRKYPDVKQDGIKEDKKDYN